MEKVKKTLWEKRHWFVFIIVGIAIVFFVVLLIKTNTGSKSKDSYGHDKFDAIAAAEHVVKDNLKSPSSAKFCSSDECKVKRDKNTWTVSGWVDADNSFGASIRNDFTVKITFTGKEKYTIDSCSIG